MEPRILIIGKNLTIVNILIRELEKFDRSVMGATDKPDILRLLQNNNPDFVILGAGFSDKERDEMLVYLISLKADLKVHLAKKKVENPENKEKGSPYDIIDFTNRKAVEWKIEQKIGRQIG